MTTYTTVDGDMLDKVCWQHYGRHKGTVEAVLNANRHLAEMPPILPAGVVVTLPDLPEQSEVSTFKLFD